MREVLTFGRDLNIFFLYLLHEAWQMKKTLEKTITDRTIDECYECEQWRPVLSGASCLVPVAAGFLLFF